jgi:hypothetical protein
MVAVRESHIGQAHLSVAGLARAMAIPPEIVAGLYALELADLEAHARIRRFVPMLALRRVQQRLRSEAGRQKKSGP